MTTVFWTPVIKPMISDPAHPLFGPHAAFYSLFQEPTPSIKYFIESRGKEDAFTKCPAFLDFHKNMFVMRAPFDYTLRVKDGRVVVESSELGLTASAVKMTMISRDKEQPPGSLPLISAPPFYTFYSKDDVQLEIHELYFTPAGHNFSVIPGAYNIGKWIRPMDWTFEIKDPSKPVIIKRGDPLLQIKFITKDGSKVDFTRVEESDRLVEVINSCTTLKQFIGAGSTLNKSYSLSESFIKLFLRNNHPDKKKSKCPFSSMFKKD